MARDLQKLQKQYNSSLASGGRGMMGGPGGPGRGGQRGHGGGRPKNMKKAIGRILHYLGEYKIHVTAVLFCLVFSTVTSLIGSYMLFPIINRIANIETTAENSGALAVKADEAIGAVRDFLYPFISPMFENDRHADIFIYVFTAIIILISVYLIGVIATYLQQRIMLTVSQGALQKIRQELFEKLQKLPVRYFDTHPTGETMSRFTNDVDTIGTMFDTSLLSIIQGVIQLVGTLIFMITTNIYLTLVTIVFIPIFIKGGSVIAAHSRKYFSAQQSALGAVNGYIEETVSGQKVIKVFNHEDECCEEFNLLSDDLKGKQFKAQFFGGIMGPIMGNTGQISYALTVGLGGVLMVTSGFTPGALTVFAQYARQFSFPINNISQQLTTIFSALAGAERVFAVMDESPEVSDLPQACETPIEGDVVFDDVTFGYVPDKIILKNISLYAHKGQKIAFVGSTGAGKPQLQIFSAASTTLSRVRYTLTESRLKNISVISCVRI